MAAGQWELRISEVLVKFGVTKERLQENTKRVTRADA